MSMKLVQIEPLSGAGKEFPLSHSAAMTFNNCRKKFYYQYVRRLESTFLNVKFLVGRMVNIGLQNLYSKRKDFVKVTLAEFDREIKKMRKQYTISAEQEQEIQYCKIIVEAMIRAYAIKYKKFIDDSVWLGSEVKIDHTTDQGTLIYGKMDNRLKLKDKMYVHELKTTKYINVDYVKNIKNDPQTALYLHTYNATHTDKLHGIVYDVIMKPSIRQKQNESKTAFIDRLSEYYLSSDAAEKKFYMEIIERPLISSQKILNMYDGVAAAIATCTKDKHFYENFDYCHVWNTCEFYDLCFKGENSATLMHFKTSDKGKGTK